MQYVSLCQSFSKNLQTIKTKIQFKVVIQAVCLRTQAVSLKALDHAISNMQKSFAKFKKPDV